ncbi:YlbE-like family protein [Metabacillus malikii]|uniref:YlbE-like protein n=1 Tax=Metabacillus malikii TaxID=1504265 RepID=A0ABT9ZG88_9BACI|nr:YlbE-like family protein [Metabacillus malikii]MDQ0231297.1 hypothetical protein [Metabacillus malikii]
MRKDVQEYLQGNSERQQFIREQPQWYRKLSRNPNELDAFQINMMNYYQKTIPHRVGQLSNSIQMAQMMLGMFHAMKNQD